MFGAQKIIIWDNDGTIMGSKDPKDTSNSAKVILPNIETIMQRQDTLNVICSGMKTPESESQNFDPEAIIVKFKALMLKLPVTIATFSPAMGGTECWVLIKNKDTTFSILKAHEDHRYKHLIGKFKKPDIGMLIVIKDLVQERNIECQNTNTIFIGDAWQDMKAAHDVGLSFLHASHIHTMQNANDFDSILFEKQTEIVVKQLTTEKDFESARNLFMSYFHELYAPIPSTHLGIDDVDAHLNIIFRKTLEAIKRGELYIVGAYGNEVLVGFTTFNTLEDSSILIRTLPVNVLYKKRDFEIRMALLNYIHAQYPHIKTVNFIIRKANEAYRLFCHNAAFVEDKTVFEDSYVKQEYNIEWYNAYTLKW